MLQVINWQWASHSEKFCLAGTLNHYYFEPSNSLQPEPWQVAVKRSQKCHSFHPLSWLSYLLKFFPHHPPREVEKDGNQKEICPENAVSCSWESASLRHKGDFWGRQIFWVLQWGIQTKGVLCCRDTALGKAKQIFIFPSIYPGTGQAETWH